MVAGPAAADAVRRAKRLPGLRVGLHLVLVDGKPISEDACRLGLAPAEGAFSDNLVAAGLRFFFLPSVRRALAREIRAQFAAFRATGLSLDHVNAHKHMHLHPTVARLLIAIGREFGMRAVRVPLEPARVLARAFPAERVRQPLYTPWILALRARLRRAGLFTNDHLFGLAWTGAMVEERLLALLSHLPEGTSEIYFHPAAEKGGASSRARPGGRGGEELEALLSREARRLLRERALPLIGYGDLAATGRAVSPPAAANGPPPRAPGRGARAG